MKPVLYILLAALLTGSVSYSLGAMLIRALALKLHRSEERFLAFLTGSACLSTVVFFLAAGGLARKWVFYAVGLIVFAAALWTKTGRAQGPTLPPIPRHWNIAFWSVFAVFTWLYLSNALAPETSADALSYHLALVSRYAREHRIPPITNNMYASLSEGFEMLFLYAFSIGKHSAPAMVEFSFLLALPFGILSYARRIGHPIAGVFGAIVIYASPIFGRVGTIAHNDVAGAAVVFGVFYAVQLYRDDLNPRMLVLAGVLAGFAYAIKYTLGIAVLYVLGAVLLTAWKRRRPLLRPATITALCALAIMAPWMIKNIIVVANPFSPFFNRVFPNPYVYASFEQGYVDSLRHFDGVTLKEVPIEATVRGDRLQGLLGPVFLLAPLALVALRFPYGRQLLIAAAVFLIPYFGNLGTRFLMPAGPFIALALGLALDAIPALAALVLLAHCVLSWPQAIPLYANTYAWKLEGTNWTAALRRIAEADYLRQNIADYDLGLTVDRLVPPNQRVLSPAMGNQTYHSREIVVPYESVLGSQLYDVMFRASEPSMQPALHRGFPFPARGVKRLRVVMAKAMDVPWLVAEVRVFLGGREIERRPQWRLRASVDPWEVQRAFDNSPLTLWTSDRNAKPGMFLEIDFGQPLRTDRVEVVMPRNYSSAVMRIEGDGALLSDKPDPDRMEWPARMRRAAMEELKANGVQWMVFKDNELLSSDLLTRAIQWGIKQEAYSNGYRLWRLE